MKIIHNMKMVGILRSLEDEFIDALNATEFDNEKRCISIATGVAIWFYKSINWSCDGEVE